MIPWQEEVFRIILGALLGGLVGLERAVRGKTAGVSYVRSRGYGRSLETVTPRGDMKAAAVDA